jgi:hypothetical protein
MRNLAGGLYLLTGLVGAANTDRHLWRSVFTVVRCHLRRLGDFDLGSNSRLGIPAAMGGVGSVGWERCSCRLLHSGDRRDASTVRSRRSP